MEKNLPKNSWQILYLILKICSLSIVFRNRTRMYALTTSNPHFTVDSRLNNWARYAYKTFKLKTKENKTKINCLQMTWSSVLKKKTRNPVKCMWTNKKLNKLTWYKLIYKKTIVLLTLAVKCQKMKLISQLHLPWHQKEENTWE